jgi:DNA-binding beta-propeller fold protein YncE
VSDIKARPDGNLYVLNNGAADEALLIMRPDGTVLKGIDLQGKTPIATGLNFGPAGDIFVADMLGGRAVRYRPGGGEPTGMYGGMNKGFNNPAGVAVTPEGNIYVAEQGFARLQKLDREGNFVKSINLACKPMHVLLSGDFLDMTCDAGLVSLNWKTDELQLIQYDRIEHKPSNPTGLTYGPDNTLYVLANGILIEYRVQH